MTNSVLIRLVDNYDSFTYNLYDYFMQLGVSVEVVRNDALTLGEFVAGDFDALVLSPGPQAPSQAGLLPALIDYYHDRIPILGICLGHQGLGEYFGWQLQRAAVPVHGKTSSIVHHGEGIFEGVECPTRVMRYHSLLITNPAQQPDLIPTAFTEEGELMAFRHRTLPIVGVQFHPESIGTTDGLAMLRNWVREVMRYITHKKRVATLDA